MTSLALAHPGALGSQELAAVWTIEPWPLLWLGLAFWTYGRGVGRMWRRAGRGRGISGARFAAFCGGGVVAAVALLSPLHGLGGVLFFAHMIQHELLILVAAPLIVLGRPLIAFAWALPLTSSRQVRRLFRSRPVAPVWKSLSAPAGAAALHAVALWIWHAPALYDATLISAAVHTAQHVSFLGSALLFWWAVFRRMGGWGPGAGVLVVFATMIHSNALGALLTFAPRPWYRAYETTAPAWGWTALEDQQLGGLIMWVPAGTVYLAISLLLMYRWLGARGSVRGPGAARIPVGRPRLALLDGEAADTPA